VRKQPSIMIAFSASFTHRSIDECGTKNVSAWHARANDGISFATMFAASRAISPRMQGPSQEKTGIFFSAMHFWAYASPAGQMPAISLIFRVKSGL